VLGETFFWCICCWEWSGIRCFNAIAFQHTLEYAIRKVQENQEVLEMNEIHHLLVCTDYVNLLSKNIDVTKSNTGNIVWASKTVGLKIKSERAKFLLMSPCQNVDNEDS
jgi:hypothetical protein